MRQVTETELKKRLGFDNPWWEIGGGIDPEYREMRPRAYFEPFMRLVTARDVRRAVVLMGPRRVGKTVMIHHTIQALIQRGMPSPNILYVSLDTPLYTGLALDDVVTRFIQLQGHTPASDLHVFFDEIQYLKDWEVHLKSLVDSYKSIRFVGSGSAAAALRLKSRESGAGRFTDFLLPPLTFAEYLRFRDLEEALIVQREDTGWPPLYCSPDIERLNEAFVEYVNSGGYPEVVFSETIRGDPSRYIRGDIIDKVLLRDLPSLYGISDIQELNSLFTTLAYNTASEVSYEALSKSSGVAKNTLRRYLEYLEAAFLVRRVRRVDRNARRFKRETHFKVYLTNPSMRAALFGPVSGEDPEMGFLAETAIFDQWVHAPLSFPNLSYARWSGGEVDLVATRRGERKPSGAVEIKWSDRHFRDPGILGSLIDFARRNGLDRCEATTRTKTGNKRVHGIEIIYEPCALNCYRVGRHAVEVRAFTDDSSAPSFEEP